MDFHRQLALSEDTILQIINDEVILLNLATESYYALNNVGARMLQLLEKTESIQQVFNTLLTEFDVSPETLKMDMRSLINDMLGHGLVEIS